MTGGNPPGESRRFLFLSFGSLVHDVASSTIDASHLGRALFYFGSSVEFIHKVSGRAKNHACHRVLVALDEAEQSARVEYRLGDEVQSFAVLNRLLQRNGFSAVTSTEAFSAEAVVRAVASLELDVRS